MSIWTFNRGLLAGFCTLLLAGCADVPDVTRRDGELTRKAPKTISVADNAVVIGGPPGYCIDRAASRIGQKSAFVLLGSCAAITRDARAGAPQVPGLLTASVDSDVEGGPILAPVLDQMEDFLAAPVGRAALARDGQADSVAVLDTIRESGALFIRLSDTSANATPGLSAEYWRGLFDVNGRLVTVSVVGFEDKPLTSGDGLAVLRAFHARIRAETPTAVAQVAPRRRLGLLNSLIR